MRCIIGAMNYGHCSSVTGFHLLAALTLNCLKTTFMTAPEMNPEILEWKLTDRDTSAHFETLFVFYPHKATVTMICKCACKDFLFFT